MTALDWQFSLLSSKRPPLLAIHMGCWRESSISTKGAWYPNHKCSASQRLAGPTLFFSSIYPISKLDVDVYLFLPSSLSFLLTHLSPLFTIGIHILFCVVLEAPRSFCNAPCTNCTICSKCLLWEGPSRINKIPCSCFNFQRIFAVRKPLQNGVPSIHHLRLSYSEKSTFITAVQFPPALIHNAGLSPKWTPLASMSGPVAHSLANSPVL